MRKGHHSFFGGFNVVHIPAIVLMQGDHQDIHRTGHGCIMNVIAYLQGEAPTDHPQGVDEAFRVLAIFCNDHLDFEPRQALLIPLVSRLMNTKTSSWHELARRLQRLLKLEREVCGGTYPLSEFLEYMGPDLPARIDCLVRQIVGATQRHPMWGREREICDAIVRALDDMLPDHELSPKQRKDMDDLGAVAAEAQASCRMWEFKPVPNFANIVPWMDGKAWTVNPGFKPIWMDEMIGAPS
jgi:hypothetical protein